MFITTLWNTLLIDPIFNVLVGLYHLTGNLGLAIIVFTLLFKILLLPIMLPSMRAMKKQRSLQPQLDKIRKKHKGDKKKLAEAQMALFKEHGLNPTAGCLTQLPMLLVLAAMIGVVSKLATADDVMTLNPLVYFDSLKFTVSSINTDFLYMNLGQPDKFFVLALLTGAAQFAVSKFSMGFTKKAEKIAKKTPDKSDDLAYNMQEQMLYVMPVVTVIFGLALPSGVVLYMLISTVFHLIQTYFFMYKVGEEL